MAEEDLHPIGNTTTTTEADIRLGTNTTFQTNTIGESNPAAGTFIMALTSRVSLADSPDGNIQTAEANNNHSFAVAHRPRATAINTVDSTLPAADSVEFQESTFVAARLPLFGPSEGESATTSVDLQEHNVVTVPAVQVQPQDDPNNIAATTAAVTHTIDSMLLAVDSVEFQERAFVAARLPLLGPSEGESATTSVDLQEHNVVTVPAVQVQPQIAPDAIAAITTPAAAATPKRVWPVGVFMKFPEFAMEIRLQIFEASILPRLVHMRPGGGKAPALRLVCRAALEVSNKKYKLYFENYHRNDVFGVFIADDIDTIYCKNRLPDMVRIKNIVPFPIEYSPPDNKAGREWNKKAWSMNVKYLMINLDEAVGLRNQRLRQGQTLWVKLKEMFPMLEELNLTLFPKIRKHHGLADFVEVNDNVVSFHQLGMMNTVRYDHRVELAFGMSLALNVKFIRLSRFASNARDAPLRVPDAQPGVGIARREEQKLRRIALLKRQGMKRRREARTQRDLIAAV